MFAQTLAYGLFAARCNHPVTGGNVPADGGGESQISVTEELRLHVRAG